MKVFVKGVKRYGLDQEYITPYTPEQNGMIERFFKTLKEECACVGAAVRRPRSQTGT